jgi:DNA-binding response OmpR family regulator
LSPSGGRACVLVAEDDPAVRRVASRALERRGYHVLQAADGDEARRLLLECGPKVLVVVTDVNMPGIGGPELMSASRRVGLPSRFLVTSGSSEDEVRARFDGSVEFLAKPWGPEDLVRCVEALLTQARGAA